MRIEHITDEQIRLRRRIKGLCAAMHACDDIRDAMIRERAHALSRRRHMVIRVLVYMRYGRRIRALAMTSRMMRVRMEYYWSRLAVAETDVYELERREDAYPLAVS